MSFNLLNDAWLEVRRASGVRDVIRPSVITQGFADDPFVALDFARPDWNAALTEWLIGLVYLTLAPENEYEWAERFVSPPSSDDLAKAFKPLIPYFDLEGPVAAFQDFDGLDKAELKPLSGLLIDAPGEQTEKNNADLFIKRGGAKTLTPAHAAAALITLQAYAPAGGAGHRTSLRGGGPLTTLVAPVRQGAGRLTSLWDRVWANVNNAEGDHLSDPKLALPWLTKTLTSEKASALVTPENAHPGLAFFACPRRIRLIFDDTDFGRVAVGYRTLNYGANYQGWKHPLSPYYLTPKNEVLPLHPHAGASDYGDWLAWWGMGDKSLPAEVQRLWGERKGAVSTMIERSLVEAFGYDMDNMKARQWLDARLPWVNACEGEMKLAVRRLIEMSDAAARALRFSLKVAVYGQEKSDGSYRLPDTLKMDALSEPVDRFWKETQAAFEQVLEHLVAVLQEETQSTAKVVLAWLPYLKREALRVFDESVDLDAMTAVNPRRLLSARSKLAFEFSEHSKASVFKAAGLTPAPKAAKSKTLSEEGGR